ncbi:hypothetical protein BU17DRAFT_86390 [Hysterangium stoloniferum]|nr:hypothetical protein BU17DRAFT_86390 [Hysterangium stoloniferum]
MASVTYFDSGNWRVDMQSGSEYGYKLLFVILLAGLGTIVLPCRCVRDPSVYTALVYFATALRISREALETLHIGGDGGVADDTRTPRECEFYRRVVELDEHIFSLSPPTPPRGSFAPDEASALEEIDGEEAGEEPDAMLEDVFARPVPARPASVQPTPRLLPVCELPHVDPRFAESPAAFANHVYHFTPALTAPAHFTPTLAALAHFAPALAPAPAPAHFTPTLTSAHFAPTLAYALPADPAALDRGPPVPVPAPFTAHFATTPTLAPSSPPPRARAGRGAPPRACAPAAVLLRRGHARGGVSVLAVHGHRLLVAAGGCVRALQGMGVGSTSAAWRS